MTIKAASKDEAEALTQSQADANLDEWATNQTAANENYGVYPY